MTRECVEKEGRLAGAMISQGGLQPNHRDQDWKMRENLYPSSLSSTLLWVLVVVGRGVEFTGFQNCPQLPVFFLLVIGYNLDQGLKTLEE